MQTIHFSFIIQAKRSISETPVHEPYNANKESSFVELVIVIDNDIYKDLNQSLDKVHKYCKDIANIINSVSQCLIKLK